MPPRPSATIAADTKGEKLAQRLSSIIARLHQGEAIDKLEFFAVIDDDQGQKTFRYMKAIPTTALCLNCHGETLSAEVAATSAMMAAPRNNQFFIAYAACKAEAGRPKTRSNAQLKTKV